MLRRWSLANFKSVLGKVELEFRPLTLFAGANSSGKSTVIQSLLLAKQTLKYAPIERALALNGPVLKLGRFDDVLLSALREAPSALPVKSSLIGNHW